MSSLDQPAQKLSHTPKTVTLAYPRLHVERFLGYAPKLNPDELVWTELKRALGIAVPKHPGRLQQLLRAPVDRLRSPQQLLWSCILASDHPW